jgi:hypothetical protein
MTANPIRRQLHGVIASVVAAVVPVAAAAETDNASTQPAPVVVAQAGPTATLPGRSLVASRAFRPLERGVREAAAESNEALRRYVWRTRMIYDYYYNDFAPTE